MHGGLLFAFADQIGATSITKIQTEISILDLPSVSGTTKLDAKPANRIQPKTSAGLIPINKRSAKRLENPSQKSTTIDAVKSAKSVRKVSERPVADAIKKVSSVQPISSPILANNNVANIANLTMPIENKHETSETKTSKRVSETNSPIPIATKPSATKTETRPVAVKILNSQKSEANNLKPTQSAQPTKITKNIKIAKLTPPSLVKRTHPTTAKLRVKASKTTTTIASRQKHEFPKIKKFIPAAKSAKSVKSTKHTQVAKLAATSKSKQAQSTTKKLKINKSTIQAKQVRKTNPASISKQKKPNLITAVARAKSSNTEIVISTSKNLKAARTKPTNSAKILTKTAKQFTPNLDSTKLVSRIRLGRIKTVKSNSNQVSPNNASIKVSILARPRQGIPKTQLKPTIDQVDGFAKVVNFLKFYNSENSCFLALPSISNQEKMVLSGFSNEKSSWPRFQKALVQNTKFGIAGRLASISDAQCQVMTFARQSSSYPSYSVSLQLDYSTIKNGEFIAGKIFTDEGRYLNLLLVDDEGTAININQYVNIKKNSSTFQLQVNLTGGEVSTSQLLLAIVTDKLLDSMRSHAAMPATKLLQNVKMEIDTRNIDLDLALTAFEIR